MATHLSVAVCMRSVKQWGQAQCMKTLIASARCITLKSNWTANWLSVFVVCKGPV